MPFIPALERELKGWEGSHTTQKLSDLNMEANTGSIATSDLGWLKPLPVTVSDEELRREYAEKGVVHLKGVMPRELVLNMRRKYFETVAPCGVLKEGSDPVDGIFVGGDADLNDFVGPDNAGYIGRDTKDCEHVRLAVEAHHTSTTMEFCQNQHLLDVVKRLEPAWKDPFILRRQLLRSNMPQAKGTSTGVHYDQIFLRGGPATALTSWVPIGDCGPKSGGLMYLEKSVSLGEDMEQRLEKMCEEKGMTKDEKLSAFNSNMANQGMLSHNAGEFCVKEGNGRKWLVGDYEAGDAVFHHSYMVHASGANRNPEGRIRLSADLRFANREEEHDERWNKGPFFVGDGL